MLADLPRVLETPGLLLLEIGALILLIFFRRDHKQGAAWFALGQIAYAQGDPALALDIIERLIASAPGPPPGR